MAEYDDLLGRGEYRELSRDELAARVQALTAELGELRKQYRLDHTERDLNRRERDAARAELAAANARADENARIGIDWCNRLGKAGEENAALSARLERVRALADEWDRTQIIGNNTYADELRAALGEDA